MNSPLPLRDIQGLDAISFWPLAPGWWILIGLLLAAFVVTILVRIRRQRQIRRWQYQVRLELEQMEKNLTPENSQATAILLSELVRRLAIHNYSRRACAGLLGDDWLAWLSQKDPAQFNWSRSARSLIEAPFSPVGKKFDVQPIKNTIHAMRGWVR
jgi:hypothetical protein